MWGFYNLLDAKEIGELDGRVVHKLNTLLLYETKSGQLISIPSCFETDLASVPRLPFIFEMWGDRAHRPAVLHDYLYRTDAIPLLSREDCDNMFKEAIKSTGEPFRVWYWMWVGVRLGGWTSYHKHKVDDNLVTP